MLGIRPLHFHVDMLFAFVEPRTHFISRIMSQNARSGTYPQESGVMFREYQFMHIPRHLAYHNRPPVRRQTVLPVLQSV